MAQEATDVTFDARDFKQPTNGIDAPVDLEMAQLMVATMEAVNLDEVTQEVLRVSVREERDVEVEHNGKTYLKKEYSTRIAEIANYVPNDVYNKMFAGRAKVLRACRTSGLDGEQAKVEMLKWQIEPVWEVWRLSEPWVETPMQLSRMLDGVKVQALFMRFFGKAIPLPKK